MDNYYAQAIFSSDLKFNAFLIILFISIHMFSLISFFFIFLSNSFSAFPLSIETLFLLVDTEARLFSLFQSYSTLIMKKHHACLIVFLVCYFTMPFDLTKRCYFLRLIFVEVTKTIKPCLHTIEITHSEYCDRGMGGY